MTAALLPAEVVFQAEPRRYFYRGKAYRSVTEKIGDVGFGPDFSHVHPDVLEFARRRGELVDLALVYHYEGDLDIMSVDPVIQPFLQAAFQFDRDCPGAIVAVHPRLCSESLAVAGTPDLIRWVRGRRAVIDWKTGVDNPLQTWMYQVLWNMKHPTQPCYARYGLRLRGSGRYVLKQHDDPDDGAAAMAILTGNKKEIERWRGKYGQAGSIYDSR